MATDTDDENLSDWEKSQRRERAWLAGLKVGDAVAVVSGGFSSSMALRKVEKVTAQHGRTIYVKGRRFDEHGRERGRDIHSRYHLVEPTQEVRDAEEKRRHAADLHYFFSRGTTYGDFALEDLRAIVAICDKYKPEGK